MRQQDGKVTSRHIRCDTCDGWVDDRWYPRCHEVSREAPITGVAASSQATADDEDWSDSTVEVEVVRVRNDPMTPLPRHNSDDSSTSGGDNTEGEDDQEIFSMCYQCNESPNPNEGKWIMSWEMSTLHTKETTLGMCRS